MYDLSAAGAEDVRTEDTGLTVADKLYDAFPLAFDIGPVNVLEEVPVHVNLTGPNSFHSLVFSSPTLASSGSINVVHGTAL